jgi:hypothetical protein
MESPQISFLNIKYNVLYPLFFKEKGIIYYLSRYIYYMYMYNQYKNIKDNIDEMYDKNYESKDIAEKITELRLKKCFDEMNRYHKKISYYIESNIIGIHHSAYFIPENIINNINRVQLFIGYSAADLFCISDLFKKKKNGKNLEIYILKYNFTIHFKLSKYVFTNDDIFNIVKMNKAENDILNNLDP